LLPAALKLHANEIFKIV